MDAHQITIIVPVLNRRDKVLHTLDTIPPCYPLIVVDNGSTDGTYQALQTYARQAAPRQILVLQTRTPGAAAARNYGLCQCHTPWVYFFDSDDTFTTLPTSEEMPQQDATDMYCFPVQQTVAGVTRTRAYQPVSTVHTHILNAMLDTVSVIYRTQWLRAIGGWDVRIRVWDDWELGVRALLARPRLRWITTRTFHRIDITPDSITGPDFRSRSKEILRTLHIVLDEIHTHSQYPQRDTLALFLRIHILVGHLRREGDTQGHQAFLHFLAQHFPTDRPSVCLGPFFQWYTAHGGRGAWRLALKFVDTFYHIK